MTFKRLTSPSAGDSTHFGGLDVNKFSDYLGGTDISGSETIDINTLTAFRNSKFSLRNPANNASYVFVPSALGASRNVTLPLLTGADQITMDAHATTLTNKSIGTDANTLAPTSYASLYTIYIAGTTVKVRNNVTGVIDYTADNTVNAVTAINSAINNIQNITNAGLDSTYAGSIFLADGKYKCTTTINIQISSSARYGIRIKGAGPGTILDFQPSSALTNGILFDNTAESGIEHLRIQANANLSNYIKIQGSDWTNQWMASRGYINDLYFEGTNFRGSFATTGAIGILNEQTTDGTPYFWHILNCHFLNLTTAVQASGANATSLYLNNIGILWCVYGIDLGGGQHFVSNVYAQGSTGTGQYAIRLRGGATPCTGSFINNVQAEMLLSSPAVCQAVLIDSGAAGNTITNIQNAGADNVTRFVVVDNSGNYSNYIQYNNYMYDSTIASYVKNVNLIFGTMTIKDNQGNALFVQAADNAPSSYSAMYLIPRTDITTVTDTSARSLFSLRNSNGSNYEQFTLSAYGTNGFSINTDHGGTGTTRGLAFQVDWTDRIKIDTTGIGFFNKAPVAQPAGLSDISTSATGTQIATAVNGLITKLEQLGLIATV